MSRNQLLGCCQLTLAQIGNRRLEKVLEGDHGSMIQCVQFLISTSDIFSPALKDIFLPALQDFHYWLGLESSWNLQQELSLLVQVNPKLFSLYFFSSKFSVNNKNKFAEIQGGGTKSISSFLK